MDIFSSIKTLWTEKVNPYFRKLSDGFGRYFLIFRKNSLIVFERISKFTNFILEKTRLNIVFQAINRFGKILLSGIRAKLALFTGSLITLTIIFLSAITVRQQTSILTQSYDKQAAISRNYIRNLVTNLENITQNLIQIEEFRLQISEQRSERKKYKTARVIQVQKKVDLFGFKTNLFGVMGKEKFRRVQDSFYSRYLSDSDILTLERKIREQLNISTGRTLSEKEWSGLQALAKKIVLAERKGQESEKIRAHSNLEHKVALYIIESKKKSIEELGLDTHRFRMQTFPVSRLGSEEAIQPSFDTKIFNMDSELAKLDDIPALNDSLLESYKSILEDPTIDRSDYSIGIRWNELELQSNYSPIFKYPDSTTRAKMILSSKKSIQEFEKYLSKDIEIAGKISVLFPKIKKRLDDLRKRKPPIPPNKDKVFLGYYKEYNSLIKARDESFDQIMENQNIKESHYLGIESLRSLRESAMEDAILLRYSTDTDYLDQYISDRDFRDRYRNRWKELRRWVSEAKSETPTKELLRVFPDATIGKSRSEAEEIIWKLDSTPLFPEDSDPLPKIILSKNFTGIIRTLVDQTDGILLIRENRNYIIISAFLIGIMSILFAVFISGIVVQKIKRIISSAEDVGHGNLQVEFEFGGSDEFGKLTIALNQMVSGLREREKIKGILGSMIDPVVVSEAMKDLQALKRGSEKTITAFFSDIASFSAISEKLSSPELADLLNEYLSAMTKILKKNDGVLDKYIGDAIVGIFNSPVDVEDHTFKAVVASIEMQQKLTELRQDWIRNDKYISEARKMSFRIGLNTGPAKVGFMGTDELASYTMMGDTVNLAARLEAAGKDYGVHILVTDAVEKEIRGRIFTRKLDVVRVKGKNEPVTLYEVIAKTGEVSKELQQASEFYEKGLNEYLKRNWKEAISLFRKCLDAKKESDKSSLILISRCESYIKEPPPADWDGVFTRTTK